MKFRDIVVEAVIVMGIRVVIASKPVDLTWVGVLHLEKCGVVRVVEV